jgi:hypothetical protein
MTSKVLFTCNICRDQLDPRISSNKIYGLVSLKSESGHNFNLINTNYPDVHESYNDFHICEKCLSGIKAARYISRL